MVAVMVGNDEDLSSELVLVIIVRLVGISHLVSKNNLRVVVGIEDETDCPICFQIEAETTDFCFRIFYTMTNLPALLQRAKTAPSISQTVENRETKYKQ